MNDQLNPGDLQLEIGWCNLAQRRRFYTKKVTAKMIDWCFACGVHPNQVPGAISVPFFVL